MGLLEPPHSSPYYPPRARWRKPISQLAGRIRVSLNRWGIRWPTAREISNTCVQLAIPGLAFYFTGQRLLAQCAVVLWVLGLVTFLVWLGSFAADLAFLMMISIHAMSLSHLVVPIMKPVRLWWRFVLGVVLFFGLAALVYEPAQHWFYANLALPLRTPEGVVIINPTRNGLQLGRSELVAFRVEPVQSQGLLVRGGYALGRVLALAGDRVRFEPDKLVVNGTVQRRLATMPDTGELKVPEKSWLIWPERGIQIYGQARPAQLAQQLLEIALVSQERLVGKPYNRWFWRKQISHEQIWPPGVR